MKRCIGLLIFFIGHIYASDHDGLSSSTDGLATQTVHGAAKIIEEPEADIVDTEGNLLTEKKHQELVVRLQRTREYCAKKDQEKIDTHWKPDIVCTELGVDDFARHSRQMPFAQLCHDIIAPFPRRMETENTHDASAKSTRPFINLIVAEKGKVILPYNAIDELHPTAEAGHFLVRIGDTIHQICVENEIVRENQSFVCPGACALTDLSNGDFAVIAQSQEASGNHAFLYYISKNSDIPYTVDLGEWPRTPVIQFKEIQPGLLSVATIWSRTLLKMILLNCTTRSIDEIERNGEPYQQIFPLNPTWVGILQGNTHLTLYNNQTQEKKMLGIDRLHPEDLIILCPQFCREPGKTILALYRKDHGSNHYWWPEHFYITDEGTRHPTRMSDQKFPYAVQYERDCAIKYDREKKSDVIKGLLIDQQGQAYGEYQFRTTSEKPKMRKRKDGEFILSRVEQRDPETQKVALLYMILQAPLEPALSMSSKILQRLCFK